MLGARVRDLYSRAQIAQQHALRIAVISAAGCSFLGLWADRDSMAGLDLLEERFNRSTEERFSGAR